MDKLIIVNPFNRESEVKRVCRARRKARDLGLPATLTLREWKIILYHFECKCAYCGVRRFTTLDHVNPLSGGGGTTADNVLPCCEKCNKKKDSTHGTHFEQRLYDQKIWRMYYRTRDARAWLREEFGKARVHQ